MRLAQAGSSDETYDAASGERARRTLAFVNNMPDGAFDATERQFLGLVEAGSVAGVIEVTRYTLEGVPRGELVAARIAADYRPIGEIESEVPDLLVVTGSNPIEVEMRDEPYWQDLANLLTWARERVPSMLLSCLSAHAALNVFDGIERRRLVSKQTGVFVQHVKPGHVLTNQIEPDILLPHSRQNTVFEDDLRDAGYEIVIESPDAGWSVASKEYDSRTMVLVQGHPEYDPSSLLREYHRDVGRYVRHERDDLPCLPYQCVSPEDWGRLEAMHHEVIGGHRKPSVVEAYPFEDAGRRAPWPWRTMAEQLYANWLNSAVVMGDYIDA
jgi:homoserine O-succinyltransferase